MPYPKATVAGPPPKVFAFISDVGGAERRRLLRVGRQIDVVAPNWYDLDTPSGSLRPPDPGPAQRLAALAHRVGAAVWPVVNANTAGGSGWENPAARQRIAAALRHVATRPGVRGVTLDMEQIRPDQRDAFTALVRDAAASVHAAHRRMAVYVPRPGGTSARAYDSAALARAVDLVLCSGYNEHWSGGPPGPVTSSGGFAAVLRQGLHDAGPAKAVPLLGAFGYRWTPSAGGRLVSSADAARLRATSGARGVRSDGSERFMVGGDTVVYETTAGLRARAAAARSAGARWIGLFSLGREQPALWKHVTTHREAARARR
jgi:spore germination protein YaaH